jgi:hypothetical protein
LEIALCLTIGGQKTETENGKKKTIGKGVTLCVAQGKGLDVNNEGGSRKMI